MEVKPGYKQTEVGLIPKDWRLERVGEIATTVASGRSHVDSEFGDYPVYGSTGIIGRSRSSAYFGKAILIARVGANAGKLTVVDGEYGVTDNTIIVRISGSYQVNYVSRQLEAKRLNSMAFGSGQPLITGTQIKGILIPLPPTGAEQEAITKALRDADAFIESLRQLIAKKRHLKQGAMQELLRPKKGWCGRKLEDIAEVIDPHPSHRAPPEVPSGIPFVGIGDLNENGDLVGTKVRTVGRSVFDEHSTRYNLDEELIGLGRVASIGKVVRLKPIGDKYVISPTLGVIRGTTVRRDYLLYALKSKAVVMQFNRIMSGSTRSSVGMAVLRKLNIDVPADETEQTTIATTLSDMGAEIAALEAKLAKARNIKQGMMQELLTGRIRLI